MTVCSQTRLQIAEAIENSSSPSRLFDCQIWHHVGGLLGQSFSLKGHDPIRPSEIIQGRWFGSVLEKYPEDIDGVAHNWRVPQFTASVDAAQTLLHNVGYVLWAPLGKKPSVSTQIGGGWSEYSTGYNEAMAMCAAALRHHEKE